MKRCVSFIQWIFLFLLIGDTSNARRRHDRARESAAAPIEDRISEICLSNELDRLVYRFKNDSLVFIGFDVVKKDTVYAKFWTIDAGNAEKLRDNSRMTGLELMPADQIRSWLTTDHLLAVTDLKQQNNFERNLSTCSQSTQTLTCVIQSFAPLARKFRPVDWSC